MNLYESDGNYYLAVLPTNPRDRRISGPHILPLPITDMFILKRDDAIVGPWTHRQILLYKKYNQIGPDWQTIRVDVSDGADVIGLVRTLSEQHWTQIERELQRDPDRSGQVAGIHGEWLFTVERNDHATLNRVTYRNNIPVAVQQVRN